MVVNSCRKEYGLNLICKLDEFRQFGIATELEEFGGEKDVVLGMLGAWLQSLNQTSIVLSKSLLRFTT